MACPELKIRPPLNLVEPQTLNYALFPDTLWKALFFLFSRQKIRISRQILECRLQSHQRPISSQRVEKMLFSRRKKLCDRGRSRQDTDRGVSGKWGGRKGSWVPGGAGGGGAHDSNGFESSTMLSIMQLNRTADMCIAGAPLAQNDDSDRRTGASVSFEGLGLGRKRYHESALCPAGLSPGVSSIGHRDAPSSQALSRGTQMIRQ